MERSRAFLDGAGLPVCYWPYAVRRVTFLSCCARASERAAPWQMVTAKSSGGSLPLSEPLQLPGRTPPK
eukprot:9197884-Lingulodinium_polyedra.AAC.1